MEKINGKCFCQKIQFKVTPPTDFFSYCHCNSCRTSHGAPIVAWTSVDRDKIEFMSGKDNLNVYESSPGISWQFCKTCGTSLFYTWPQKPEKLYITVSNLDTIDREADCHINYNEHLQWFHFKDHLPKVQGITGKRFFPEDEYASKRFVIYLNNVSDEKPDNNLIKAHVSYIQELEKQRKLELAGPFCDGKGGMLVIKVKNLEEATEVAKNDPFVKTNKKNFEIREIEISHVDNGHLGVAADPIKV